MKMRRIAGLLLTAACAVSLLCPAAWAVNASSVDKSGGNVRLSYRLQMPAVEDSAKIGEDVKAQVKTTARRTSNSVVEIDMNSRADAESQLGMKFVSSSTFDALPQGGGTDNVVVSFKLPEDHQYHVQPVPHGRCRVADLCGKHPLGWQR